MAIKTYDSTQVSLIIGVTPITGYARDTGIKVTFEDNQFSVVKDNRGNTIRSKLNGTDALIEVNLTQDSISNDLLSNYAEADRLNNAGTFSAFLKDSNGTSLFQSASAWIEERPEPTFALELGVNTWIIRAINIGAFIGGVK